MSKKASGKSKDDQTYELRDIVLAKIRGYPAWPAMVVDPESVPKTVTKERPQGKKQTWYCVRFFPVGDYSWVLSKDLSKLQKHEIEAYIAEPHKKSGDLLTGYQIALDPTKWEEELEEQRLDLEEIEEAEEVDELDGEEEIDDEEKPAKTKKRKRDSESAPKPKPKAKKEKDSATSSTKKKKSPVEKVPKGKKNGAKSKALVESEDDGEHGEDDAGPSKKTSSPPSKKAKREKEGEDESSALDGDPEAMKVKEWRHKLQRGFLGKTPPKEDDMPQFDKIFTTVEEADLSIQYLQHSKIGKVMRHIANLAADKVPRDEDFKFRERAQALVNKWQYSINSKGAANGDAKDGTTMEVDQPTQDAGTTDSAPNGTEKAENVANGDATAAD